VFLNIAATYILIQLC